MSNAAPGWYPAGDGLRWWDGTAWTEKTQPLPAQRSTAPQVEPGTLWNATGKPLTGLGAGHYRLTDKYLFFEKGGLRTNAQQFPIHELYDVDATQSLAQKARGVGTITLHVRRPDRMETVLIEDVPNFREGVRAINDAANAERERLQTRASTQTINYAGALPFAQAPATAQQGEDVYAQLERLGKLRDAGVLTPEEFDAKKAELLRRI